MEKKLSICWYGVQVSPDTHNRHPIAHGLTSASTTSDLHVIDPYRKSRNALDRCPTMHHFLTEMCTQVHISVTKWCIVGYETGALWDFCNRSNDMLSRKSPALQKPMLTYFLLSHKLNLIEHPTFKTLHKSTLSSAIDVNNDPTGTWPIELTLYMLN